ncbi:hypothetical protein MY10362_001282 [Beauveria mimosiformis]
MKFLIFAAVACASLTATATAAPTADVVAACRSTIDDVFDGGDDGDDDDKRKFCGDFIGTNAFDFSVQNAKLPGWSVADIRDQCGAGITLMSVCRDIAPAAVVTHCRSSIDEVFVDDDGGKRDFCADVISGNTFDVLAKNAKLAGYAVASIRDKCDAGNTLMSVCRDITPAAVVAAE